MKSSRVKLEKAVTMWPDVWGVGNMDVKVLKMTTREGKAMHLVVTSMRKG